MGDFFDSIFDPGGDERDAAAASARQAALRGGRFFGPGGQSAGFRVANDGRVSATTDIGDLGPLRQALLALAGGRLGQSVQGVPALRAAAQNATESLGPVNVGGAGSFDFANALRDSGVFRGIQSGTATGVRNALDLAGQDLGEVASDRLALLRERAQPFEERAFSDLQDNLFATGRSGTTGGGLQTEAFARGLAQADLGRQLSAFDTARAVRSDAVNQARGLGSQLMGFRTLEDSLVNTAFGRALQGANLNTNRALSRFGVAGELLDSRLRRQIGQQGLGLRALQGVRGIGSDARRNFALALQTALARSGAQQGVAANLAGIAGQATQAGLGTFSNLTDLLEIDF